MDPDIDRLKQHLEDGYIITSISMSFDALPEYSHEAQIELKKGEVVKNIKSSTTEFLEYINHFKPVKDQYDNQEFVYIEDLARFNKIAKESGKKPLLKDRHKLKISGRTFSNGILTQVINPSELKKPIGYAIFWLSLKQNPDFNKVDFKDWIDVFDLNDKLIFRGLIKNYDYSESYGIITIQDISLKLQNEKISAEFHNMDREALALLSLSSGINPEGIPFNKTERNFIVIVPIQNLITDENFIIGNVEFYQNFTTMDDSLIRKSGTGRNDILWNGNFPRAKTIVKASTFFEAIIKGYDAISRALDVISLRTDLSFPSIMIGKSEHDFRFSYYKYLSRVKITKLIYCREMDSKSYTFFNMESIRENILSMNVDSQKFFSEVILLFGDLITKGELSREENNILQVLHWLRRSLQEGTDKDKFLGLWIAFEFLIAGEEHEKLFSDDEKTKLKALIEETDITIVKKEVIKSKINMLNDMPLLEKFKQQRERLNIDFSSDELDILSKMRVKRTDIIHGKRDILVNDEELNKMRTILEKLLIGKINKNTVNHCQN